jgi:hypothetical protein
MKRYFVLVLGLALVFAGGSALMYRMEKFRFVPQQPRQGPIVEQLLGTAMPIDVMDLQFLLDDLSELRLTAALESIRMYQAYRALSHALGAAPDAVATVGDTVSWARDFPDRTESAKQAVMANALSVRLALPGTAPPKAGRSGFNWNREFTDEGGGVWTISSVEKKGTRLPLYYFVVEVENRLRDPLIGFGFFLVVGDTGGQRADLPGRSYIQCDNNNYASREAVLPPGADRQLLCELQVIPEAAISPADFARVLQQVRSGALRFSIWTKDLAIELPGNHSLGSLQLRDAMVSAEYRHAPSAKIEHAFVQGRAEAKNPAGSLAARSTCEQRGDCAATFMKSLSMFEGFIQQALFVLSGMLPGAIAAGLVIALARTSTSRKVALVFMAVLSVAAFPAAFAFGGSGWGPLAALIYLAFAMAGFWAGVLLGWRALRPTGA